MGRIGQEKTGGAPKKNRRGDYPDLALRLDETRAAFGKEAGGVLTDAHGTVRWGVPPIEAKGVDADYWLMLGYVPGQKKNGG